MCVCMCMYFQWLCSESLALVNYYLSMRFIIHPFGAQIIKNKLNVHAICYFVHIYKYMWSTSSLVPVTGDVKQEVHSHVSMETVSQITHPAQMKH